MRSILFFTSTLSARIGLRYIFSKTTPQAVNIISAVSMLGMGVGAAALLLILSVFNGLLDLNVALQNTFYPDITIQPVKGKVFVADSDLREELLKISGVSHLSVILEENALLRNRTGENEFAEHVVVLKGVDENYVNVSDVDSAVRIGDFILEEDGMDYIVIGAGVRNSLSAAVENGLSPLSLFLPSRTEKSGGLMGQEVFERKIVYPSGVFSIQLDFDNKYAIADIGLVRKMLDYEGEEATAIEMKCTGDPEYVKAALEERLGERFIIKNRLQMNDILYKVMKGERLAIYVILVFILIIAAFNIIGSLSLLVIDKQNDIRILRCLGIPTSQIRAIFLFQGVISSGIAALTGITIGSLIVLLQENFGIVKLQGSGTFVVDSYPVALHLSDIVLVFITVLIISSIASYIPSMKAGNEENLRPLRNG